MEKADREIAENLSQAEYSTLVVCVGLSSIIEVEQECGCCCQEYVMEQLVQCAEGTEFSHRVLNIERTLVLCGLFETQLHF